MNAFTLKTRLCVRFAMSGQRPRQIPTLLKSKCSFMKRKLNIQWEEKKYILRGIINCTLKSAHGNRISSTELVLLPVLQCTWHGSRYFQMSDQSTAGLLKKSNSKWVKHCDNTSFKVLVQVKLLFKS